MSFLSSIFGGDNTPSPPPAPTWAPDPLVGQSDSSLFNFGSNVLQGILPSTYQDLVQTNSPQFQQMMANSNAQIQGAGLSTAAMQGNARSGAANAGITSAIASNTANLSYQDLLNTQLNQKALLGTGLDALQAGGNMALTNQGQQNSFASNIFSGLNQQYGTQMSYNQAMTQLSAQLGSQLIGGTGSAIGNLPFMNAGSGAGSGSGLGGFSTGAANDGSTFNIDALLAQGAPMALAAA